MKGKERVQGSRSSCIMRVIVVLDHPRLLNFSTKVIPLFCFGLTRSSSSSWSSIRIRCIFPIFI